jgi:tellurite resistance protein TerA
MIMTDLRPQSEVTQADRTLNEFSSYQGVLGQAGITADPLATRSAAHLGNPGDQIALSPGPSGFPEIYVGCSWHQRPNPHPTWLDRLWKRPAPHVDLDLGCLYELQDGTTGALQALGANHGSFAKAPYIVLSHDDRTGARAGDDEFMRVNGAFWTQFRRVLIYAYIYDGAANWAAVKPDLMVRVAGQPDVHLQLRLTRGNASVCALGLIEQIRGGLKLTNLTQYFQGQAEMDRAFGFGIQWQDGTKGPV